MAALHTDSSNLTQSLSVLVAEPMVPVPRALAEVQPAQVEPPSEPSALLPLNQEREVTPARANVVSILPSIRSAQSFASTIPVGPTTRILYEYPYCVCMSAIWSVLSTDRNAFTRVEGRSGKLAAWVIRHSLSAPARPPKSPLATAPPSNMKIARTQSLPSWT